MVDINYIEKKLLLKIKKDDLEVFNKLEKGMTKSIPICYTFENWDDEIAVDKIYSAKNIVKETKEYNKIALRDDIPIIPAHCFIFAIDIGGDPIIYDSMTGKVLYAGEVTFYELAELCSGIESFSSFLREIKPIKEELSYDYSFFSEDDIIKIFLDLNLELSDSVFSSFKTMPYGIVNARSFEFLYNNSNYTSIIEKILNPEEIVIVTNEHRVKSLINNHTMVIAIDPAGFYICLSLKSLKIFILYEDQILLLDSLEKLIDTIVFSIFEFTHSDMKILNPSNNSNLSNFLLNIRYGITDIDFKYKYKGKKFKDKIYFIYGFNYLKTINNDNNIFIFGTTKNNKELAFDLINNNILLIINENYIPLDINLSLIRE